MAGSGVRKGIELNGVSVLDIAPTVLYLCGLPVGRDMDGKVLLDAFEKQRPTRYIPTYEKPRRDAPGGNDTGDDTELINRLKAVGYMQ
jgi:arylsulfatase A-like enzyme